MAICTTCNHDSTFHAMSGQGRLNLPCEYPDCDCQDFTESRTMTTPPAAAGVPELPKHWIPSFAAQGTWEFRWSVSSVATGQELLGPLKDSEACFISDLLNAVYMPNGLRDQLAAKDERIRELEGWHVIANAPKDRLLLLRDEKEPLVWLGCWNDDFEDWTSRQTVGEITIYPTHYAEIPRWTRSQSRQILTSPHGQ